MKKSSSKIRKAYNFGGRSNENERVRGYDYFHSKVCIKNKGSLIKIPAEIKGEDDGSIYYHFLVDCARENENSYIPRWEKIKEGIQSNDAKWCSALQKMYRDLKEIRQMVDERKSELLESINKGDLESIKKSLGHFKEAHVPTVSRILCKMIESSEEIEKESILEAIKKIDTPESGVVATLIVYLKCLAEKDAKRDDLKEEPKEQERKQIDTKTTKDSKENKEQIKEKDLKKESKEKQVIETKKDDLRNDQVMIDEPAKVDSKPQQPRDDDLIGFEEPNDAKGIQDWLEINPLPDKVTEVYIHHPVQLNQKKREREGEEKREENKRSHTEELMSK